MRRKVGRYQVKYYVALKRKKEKKLLARKLKRRLLKLLQSRRYH